MFDSPSHLVSPPRCADNLAFRGASPCEPLGAQVTLAELPLGASARIVGVNGGRELNRRLLALGLRLGCEVRIEHHRGRGRVVSVGPTRVALGGGIVEKLLVEPLDASQSPPQPVTSAPI